MSPERARERGLTSTITFPRGNLAPEGSVIKSTAIDPSVVDADGVYRNEGPARVFVREKDAIAAIKKGRVQAGDVLVLAGCGPLGTGMEETYQLTSALKHLPFGKHVALITDARFTGVSTGACIGHVGPGSAGGRADWQTARRRPSFASSSTGANSRARWISSAKRERTLHAGGRRDRFSRDAPRGDDLAPAEQSARRHASVGRVAAGRRRHLGRLRL